MNAKFGPLSSSGLLLASGETRC